MDTVINDLKKLATLARKKQQFMESARILKFCGDLILQKQKEQPLDFKNKTPEEILEFCRINSFNI